MTEPVVFEDLIDRLECFGEALDFDDSDVSKELLHRIATPRRSRLAHRWLVAASCLLVVAGVVMHPDSRHAVARWFGLDGLVIEVDPDLPTQALVQGFDAPGPGESRVVVVEGRQILVSAVRGTLSDGLITKTVEASNQSEEVAIDGLDGLWISGAPHEVLYKAPSGEVVVERVSANMLVWQDADVLYRVEGFANLDDALAFFRGGNLTLGRGVEQTWHETRITESPDSPPRSQQRSRF